MMTVLPRLALSLLLATSCCLLVFGSAPTPSLRYSQSLYLDNGLSLGYFGYSEMCETGSFVAYAEALFEPYSALHTDETALNALILYCADLETDRITGHITSTAGEKGELQGMKACPTGFITGVRARVLEDQGAFGDDVAVQNFQFLCDNSTIITAIDEEEDSKIPLGVWGSWDTCYNGTAVCGLMTRFDELNLYADDGAISDVILHCCYLSNTRTN
ncbi:vitelline membrane outer layer protein 1-like [Eriocheir sinensis]|uniref:vitelline membrane outer layer protein 1-like n=1 Tax=Eriocheir sinensis TaxID=95602 RepID=UPI0021C5D68E|nr:vitelline membrane outer layer protein 1-like [Eriocheir sinensis]